MARHAQAFKDRVVARLLAPEVLPVAEAARQYGVSVATLERWRSAALGEAASASMWSAAARLEAVIATASLDENSKSAWCRQHGVFPSELDKWRRSAVTALADPAGELPSPKQIREDRKRIKTLERELHRKDKALAETAALLVLAKKLSAIYGEGADA